MRHLRYGLAALWIACPFAASAQSLAQAHDFVAGLYGAYHGDGPDYLGRQANAVFSPRLLALIRRDRARTPRGDAPSLEGDPICDCQDFEGLKLTDLKVAAAGAGRAVAAVRVRNAGATQTLKLDLVSAAGAWRVDDVHSADTPSLAAFLSRRSGGR
jgi:hypothetical protein